MQAAYTEPQNKSQVAHVDSHTTEEKAKDWLAGIAREDEDVKEKVLQEL